MTPSFMSVPRYAKKPDLDKDMHEAIDRAVCRLINNHNLPNVYPEKFKVNYDRKARKEYVRFNPRTNTLVLNIPKYKYKTYAKAKIRAWLMLHEYILYPIRACLIGADPKWYFAICLFLARKLSKYFGIVCPEIDGLIKEKRLEIKGLKLILKKIRILAQYRLFYELLMTEICDLNINENLGRNVKLILQIVKDFIRPKYHSQYIYEKDDGTCVSLIQVGTPSVFTRKLQQMKSSDEIIEPYTNKTDYVKKKGGKTFIISRHNDTFDWARKVIASNLDYLVADDVMRTKKRRIMYGVLEFPQKRSRRSAGKHIRCPSKTAQ